MTQLNITRCENKWRVETMIDTLSTCKYESFSADVKTASKARACGTHHTNNHSSCSKREEQAHTCEAASGFSPA
jgi:hypothetical protein